MSANTRKSSLRRDELLANVGDLVPTSQHVIIGTGSRWTTAHATSIGGGGSSDHASLSNLSWTTSGHTGTASRIAAFDGSGAASYLQVGVDVQAYSAQLVTLAGLAPADGAFIVGDGAAFVTESGATARASLGLGSLATQSTISNADWSGTDLAVVNGGTGASDAATARSNLGLAIGTNVQAWDADLDTIAGLAKTDGNFIVADGANWTVESGATARASLGLGTIATQSAASVSITGGSITGITDLAIADGGTGSSTAAGACSNLGVGTEDTPTFSGLILDTTGNTTLTIDKGGASIGTIAWTNAGAAGASIYLDGSEDLYIKAETSDRDIFIELNDGGVNTRFMHFDASLVRVAIGASAPGYHFDTMSSNSANGAFVARVYNSDTGSTADVLRVEVGAAAAGASNILVGFYDAGGLIGSVTGDGTGVAYNVTSDRRHKRDIEDADRRALAAALGRIRVRQYRWHDAPDGPILTGVVAQELAEVWPAAVSGPREGSEDEPAWVARRKDGSRHIGRRGDVRPEDAEDIGPGHPDHVPMGVDYSKLVPLLVAAVQDLTARLEASERTLAELRVRLR